jgi:hypothetical protein
MKRRAFLEAAGVTGIAGVGTVSGRTSTGRAVDESTFGTVVDAAAEGADPTGEEPVNDVFEEFAGDDTLLQFEPGTYLIDYFRVGEFDRFGVVGSGEDPARFVPAAGDCRGGHPWVHFGNVDSLHLENLLFDFREASSGGPIHLFLHGDSTLRDVRCLGSCSNQIAMVKVEVRDPDGSARIENLLARNVGDNHSLTGVFVAQNHAGDLLLEECTLERFSDNGLYASAPGGPDGNDGRVRVVGGTYRNNNVSGLRLGTTGSRIADATVVVDDETPGWGELNARGIRLRNKSGQVIEGCDITFGAAAADSFGAIAFHPANGGALIRDTTITIDRPSVPAVRCFPERGDSASSPVFENCTIRGRSPAGVTGRIEGRDGTVFKNCTIDQRGSDRRGLQFRDSEDCRIVDSRLTVANAPVAVDNGTVTIENSTLVTPSGERHIDSRTLADETLRTDPWVTVPGGEGPAWSLDGDSKLEDVDGDGDADLFDALHYYNERDSDAIRNNPDAFDFDGDGQSGTLFDALQLYNEIS